jgi:hypothetical protein
MSERPQERGGLRGRQAGRRAEQREQQRVPWGGPVDADRVLAFSDAVFAIAIILLTLQLQVRPGLHGSAFTTGLRDLLPSLGAYAEFRVRGRISLAGHLIGLCQVGG